MTTLREQMNQLVEDMKNESTRRNRQVAELQDFAADLKAALGEGFEVELRPGSFSDGGQNFHLEAWLSQGTHKTQLFRLNLPDRDQDQTQIVSEDGDLWELQGETLSETALRALSGPKVLLQLRTLHALLT